MSIAADTVRFGEQEAERMNARRGIKHDTGAELRAVQRETALQTVTRLEELWEETSHSGVALGLEAAINEVRSMWGLPPREDDDDPEEA